MNFKIDGEAQRRDWWVWLALWLRKEARGDELIDQLEEICWSYNVHQKQNSKILGQWKVKSNGNQMINVRLIREIHHSFFIWNSDWCNLEKYGWFQDNFCTPYRWAFVWTYSLFWSEQSN